MNEYLVTLISSVIPLAISLLTAVVGLIVTALKYKKQKYAIAMLEEQNKFIENNKNNLTPEEVEKFRSILERVDL